MPSIGQMKGQMPSDTETGDEQTGFLDAIRASLADGTFLKLTLGKYRGKGEPAKAIATRVMLKEVPHVRLVVSAGRQTTTENDLPDGAIDKLSRMIGADYLNAVLFTTREDVTLAYSKKRIARLTRGKPTLAAAPPTEHDRRKDYLVDTNAPYLSHLGVTHGDGDKTVKPSMYAKFRQICRFVEILDQLIAASHLKETRAPRIVDVGSGKGYLTFALHEHLTKQLGKTPTTRGVESNATLAAKCNAIATACAHEGLSFEAALAEQHAAQSNRGSIDILIALHACDTATDDAIHLGLTSGAEIIVCAPCCQHELAPQLETRDTPLAGLLKYGLLKQRQADLFTDAARGLLLEARGYEVRMIEFVSTEHTAKNLMIAAVRSGRVDRKAAVEQYEKLSQIAGFEHQRLKSALGE